MSAATDVLVGLQARGIKLGLDKVRALLERLGSPHRSMQVVQIGGTNGKGSVALGLESIALSSGTRVATFTSPHLVSPAERIRYDGVTIPETELEMRILRLDERLREWAREDSQLAQVTYFEFLFALAVESFRDHAIDLAILEVGMGGRLDATTTAEPDLTCITSIALDHQAFLGPDLASIAAEKAGIARWGTPLFIGPMPPEAEELIRAAARKAWAPVYPVEPMDGVHNAMPGAHQRINAALSLALADQLGLMCGRPALQALARTAVPARCEVIPGRPSGGPMIVLDGCHNPDGARALTALLDDPGFGGGRATDLLISIGRDKDARGILEPLLPRVRRVWVTAYREGRGAADPEQLAQAGGELGGRAQIIPDAAEALAVARGRCDEGGRLLVAGSLFLAGELRPLLVPGEYG